MVDLNKALQNKKGGIFIVSNIADKNAIDSAINQHQLRQLLDGKTEQEQSDLLCFRWLSFQASD